MYFVAAREIELSRRRGSRSFKMQENRVCPKALGLLLVLGLCLLLGVSRRENYMDVLGVM